MQFHHEDIQETRERDTPWSPNSYLLGCGGKFGWVGSRGCKSFRELGGSPPVHSENARARAIIVRGLIGVPHFVNNFFS